MFKEIYGIEDVIRLLYLDKLLFENEDGYSGLNLDGEYFYTTAWETLMYLACEYVEFEMTESVMYKFQFPEMYAFYNLCKEHSKQHNIKFKKNPYVKAAEKYVDDVLYSSNAQNFVWNLWIPRKEVNKRTYILMLELGMYFEDYLEIIEALFNIRNYYSEQIKKLKEELYGFKIIMNMPNTHSDKTEERKAA